MGKYALYWRLLIRLAVFVKIITSTPSIQCSIELSCFCCCFFVHLVLVTMYIRLTNVCFSVQIRIFNIHISLGMPLKILRKVYSYGVFAVLITGNFAIIEIENSDRKQMFVHLNSYKYINHRQNTFNNGKFCT